LKIFKALIFLPSVLSCQIQSKSFNNNLNCNKVNSNSFENCIYKNFPIGSSYSELKLFLSDQGFKEAKDLTGNEFYFFWQTNNLANYKIVVNGRYNHEEKISKINIIP
jgi:hypothetical protein